MKIANPETAECSVVSLDELSLEMKRLMSREMLKELILLIEPHKDSHQHLYEYLMMTWVACHYNSTLYAFNSDGAIALQYHLSEFDEDIVRYYNGEKKKGFKI